MLVLFFVTDQRSHFVKVRFQVFGSLFQRRCGVLLADCCGSGTTILPRRCAVPMASCCWQRQSSNVPASAVAVQTNSIAGLACGKLSRG